MAYSAKCDTATSTKWWITGTGSVVNRLSEVMDDNAAGVEEDDNPGNFQPWATFMTEHVEDGLYQVHLDFEIGDGVIPTTLESFDEFVYFDNGVQPTVKNNAILNIGKLGGGSSPQRGAAWRWQNESQGFNFINATGTFTCYASYLQIKPEAAAEGPEFVANCSAILERVIISQEGVNQFLDFWFQSTNLSMKHIYISDGRQPALFKATPSVIEDFVVGDGAGNPFTGQENITITEADWYDTGANGAVYSYNSIAGITVIMKDPKTNIVTVKCFPDDDAEVIEQYTCNIHIADKDGADLAGVVVDCEDQFGNPVWAAGTITTNAGGDITEQIINYKMWYGTSETLIDYSPHKFTISKAGYETMVLDAVTVDGKINWHLELLDELAEGDVRDGVAYGEDSEGNLELPAVGDVEDGVGFGSNGVEFTGDFKVPPEADVRDGEGYGAGGAEFEGDLDLPAIGDVEKGVDYDGATKTGTFKSPAEADVRESEGYGAGDVEFTGALDLPAIGDVEKGVQFDSLTKTGTFKKPAEADVRDGSQYGKDDTEFTGTLDLPAEADVEDGVTFDGATKEGNFEAPVEADVEDGIGYGADGAEFEGNLELPAEEDVEVGVGYGSLGTEFEGDLEVPVIGDVRDGVGFGADGTELVGILDLPSISDVKLHTIFDNGTKEGTYICPIPAGEMIAYLEESTNLIGEIES